MTRVPEDPFWKKFAAEASRVQIAVDVFAFPSQYMDLASLGALCKYTCGQLYYYPQFNATQDAPKLRHELHHNLTRTTGEAHEPSYATHCMFMSWDVVFVKLSVKLRRRVIQN